MIQANELRIGNLLQDEDGAFPVTKTFFSLLEINLETCKPIPLTEEWLLKFGFEKVCYEKYAHKKLNKLRAYPHVMKNGFGIYLMDSYGLPHIKYVHQLQNLYFALTGTELKLTL